MRKELSIYVWSLRVGDRTAEIKMLSLCSLELLVAGQAVKVLCTGLSSDYAASTLGGIFKDSSFPFQAADQSSTLHFHSRRETKRFKESFNDRNW